MNFLAPALLLGGLASGLIVLAHLLGRREPEVVPFAALRFLAASDPQVARRRSLRDKLLFFLRLAMWLALVAALARPVSYEDGGLSVYGKEHDAVLLIDASASSQLRVDGARDLDRGLDQARELVDALSPGSRVAWLFSDGSAPSQTLGPADASRLAPAQRYIESGAAPIGGGLDDALDAAIALLGPDEGRPRVIYAISDPSRGGLGSLPTSLAGNIVLIPISTRPRAEGAEGADPGSKNTYIDPEHVGLGLPRTSSAREVDPRALRISVPVFRHGGEQNLEVEIALEVDGQEQSRTRVLLEPDSREAIEFTHVLVGAAQDARARVFISSLDEDPLAVDDERELWLSANSALRVAVINGDPSERREFDEVYFLVTALDAADPEERIVVRGLSPEQIERELAEGREPLKEIDVLVMANVQSPSARLSLALGGAVREGMGLWISVGDRVSAAHYNEVLDPILPLRLRDANWAGTAPGRSEARVEGMAPAKLGHPIFAGLDAELALSSSRTRRLFLLEPDARRDTDVALSFASGAPALLSRKVGRGQVVLLATSIDRDWSDLALRPGFVSLVERTVTWLAGARRVGSSGTSFVLDPRHFSSDLALDIVGPDGVERRADSSEGLVHFTHTRRPGLYSALPVSSDGAGRAAQRFGVLVDPSESDTQAVAFHAPATDEASPVRGRKPRWRELLAFVALALALESWLRVRAARQG